LEPADVRGLLALLLVDGSLMPYRSPSGGYVQLTLTAGVHESAFLEEKVAEFRHFIATEAQIAPYKTAPRHNGRCSWVLRFRVSTNRLRPIYNLLYPHGERTITPLALELLGGNAAAWLWAEGARPRNDGSVELARVGRSPEEAQQIAAWLELLTGAQSRLDEQRVQPRLQFNCSNADKLRQALAPYAPSSRRHLFTREIWDERSLRSARTELLLGPGEAQPQGGGHAPMADAAATGDRAALPKSSAAAVAALA